MDLGLDCNGIIDVVFLGVDREDEDVIEVIVGSTKVCRIVI